MFCYHNKSLNYVFPLSNKIKLLDLFEGFFSYEGLVKVCSKARSEKTVYKFLLKYTIKNIESKNNTFRKFLYLV